MSRAIDSTKSGGGAKARCISMINNPATLLVIFFSANAMARGVWRYLSLPDTH